MEGLIKNKGWTPKYQYKRRLGKQHYIFVSLTASNTHHMKHGTWWIRILTRVLGCSSNLSFYLKDNSHVAILGIHTNTSTTSAFLHFRLTN